MNRIVKLALLLSAAAAAATACNGNMGQRGMSTVSVVGTGTVTAQPDMVRMDISLSHTAATTAAAQQEVNKMVGQALEVLKGFGVEDKDITTASLSFSPQYQFTGGQRKLVGQNARQTITFSVNDIRDNDEKAARIIDELVRINGIELNRMNFGVKDNTGYFVQARELAFGKAAEKAKQFADLSGLKVGRVLSISEEGSQQVLPVNLQNAMRFNAFAETAADTGSTMLPSGEQEITTRISAVFILE